MVPARGATLTGLEFDPVAHRYKLDGRPVPGVTSILKSAGLVDTEWAKEWHLQRGSAIHRCMELYVRGTLDWDSVDVRIRGYVMAGARFLTDAQCELETAEPEVMVASRKYGYAGKVDLVAVLFGVKGMLDYKSGGLGAVGPQLAGYETAYREERGGPILPRFALQLKPDGKYKYKQMDDFGDYLVWCECLEKSKGRTDGDEFDSAGPGR